MALSDWNWGKPQKGLPWPNGEDGKPVRPAFLTHLNVTDMEGQIVMSLLESAEIPVVTQYPNNGEFGKVIIGVSGTGIELYVPEHLLEDAQGLLNGEFEEFEELEELEGEFEEDDFV